MTTNADKSKLAGLIADAYAIAEEAQATFGGLTGDQINWKPNEEQWSIGQTFEHLMTGNRAYFPTFTKIVRGEKTNTFWESLPLLPEFFGRMFIKYLDPHSPTKLKAPPILRPSSSAIDEKIISRFVAHQHELVPLMKATEDMDLHAIKVTSPISSLFTFSLIDCYTILISHEKRHFRWAKNVLASNGFPSS
jgi:hypothetical protein